MMISDADIKREFLAAGFTVKAGHGDLKPYVYEAARRLLALAAVESEAMVAAERERCAKVCEALERKSGNPPNLPNGFSCAAAIRAGA